MIDGLLSAAAYSHPVKRIELLETHISWIVLTGEFAYKIKKPVNLGFLDFRTLEQRRHFCEEELRLNRSWAPRLYLDVVPIVVSRRTSGDMRVAARCREAISSASSTTSSMPRLPASMTWSSRIAWSNWRMRTA